MAPITPSTFDPLRRYVHVRLQQGVPVADADINELDDARKFENQVLGRWFVGDGVPEGNDGFKITALPGGPPPPNDFMIQAGVTGAPDGLSNAGRILVDGLDVLITADVIFTGQALHEDNGASADTEAVLVGAAKVAALNTPGANGTVLVYLDVWERLVTPNEDPDLVLVGLGTETCARLKREWAVRAVDGPLPAPGGAGFVPGHHYTALAQITRRAGDDAILASDILDLRERRLLTPPATLATDLFGISAQDYRRGIYRPPLPLRDVINAALNGQLPGSPERAVAPSAGSDLISRSAIFDPTGWNVFFSSTRAGPSQIFMARLPFANPDTGAAAAPIAITGGPQAAQKPHAVMLPTGEVVVVYQRQIAPGNNDLFLKRALPGALTTATPEVTVEATGGLDSIQPMAAVAGGQVVVIWYEGAGPQVFFNRYDPATNSFPSPKQQLSPVTAQSGANFGAHAAVDATGQVWVAYQSNNIHVVRLPLGGAPIGDIDLLAAASPNDQLPFVLIDSGGDVWVFWSHIAAPDISIQYRRFLRATSTWFPAIAQPPLTVTGTETGGNAMSTAIADADGGIWLFYQGAPTAGPRDVWTTRFDPGLQAWGQPRQLTGATEADLFPLGVRGPDNAVWLVWQRVLGVAGELFYRRLVTSI